MVVLLGNGIEFVIVTACTMNRQPQKSRRSIDDNLIQLILTRPLDRFIILPHLPP